MKFGKVYHRVNDRQTGKYAEVLAGGIEKIAQLATRREFLRRSAMVAGAAAVAGAVGVGATKLLAAERAVKTGQFVFPRLQFTVEDNTPDIWNVWPIGDANLRKKLEELTNINVSQDPKIVHLRNFDDMCLFPFVFMTSEGFFSLPLDEKRNLQEFLERGGFIFADDCVFAAREDRFFQAYRKIIDSIFTDNPMRKIPYDHDLFHIYFDFARGAPHMQGVDSGAWGLFEPGTGRLMTIVTPGDLHCGWVCRFWPMEKNMEAIKMGINIIIYFLSH